MDDDTDNPIKFSDVEAVETVHREKKCFIVGKNKTRAGGSFFPYLNITIFGLSKYCVFKSVDKNDYKHNCLYLALQASGLSGTKLKELILTLRNRHIHKCDQPNVCNALEINIELTSIRTDGKKSDVEHYPQSPHIAYDEKYNLGLVKGQYFINDYTEPTSYNLEHYEEIKDIKDCNKIFKKYTDKYNKSNDRFIKAFQ